ncbi:membrane magnesium transporter, putative [Plasmodium malariae]|uniref:Membrane magnesium transporter, putative n=1 Tax=Plasmodium malariae TaxID=5858 RepID=A0A1C3KYT6_PLAMA|nr:membrane magnesium transporter, putative [Plasmodium malariae]
MIGRLSASITLVGLASLLKCGHSVYLLLSNFKMEKDNIDNFSLPITLVVQIIICALITVYGGSKLFLNFENINGGSAANFDNYAWDRNHARKSFRPCVNRKHFIKDYVKDYLVKSI